MGDRSADGAVALITGAGTGIGRVVARRFAAEGHKVVLAARRLDPLAQTASMVADDGGTAWVRPADLRSEDDCRCLVAETVERFGRLDILVNNAASPGRDQTVAEMDLANWNDTIATDLTAPMVLSREALVQAMIPAGSGNIQFFSSAAAKAVVARKAHYSVAKMGLLPLARTMAMEVGPLGIRVNTLVIGTVDGELVDGYAQRMAAERNVPTEQIKASLASGTALGRLVDPAEVAEVSLWLASPASSAITGQDLNVTAGDEKR
jgi:NAD(P)-dependent dehydrogenase (short-subunit alcohol dehydrogenase family)